MSYFFTEQLEINDFSSKNISDLYSEGFVFTRIGKGILNKTRSLRINLEKFSLNSENRRVQRKIPDLSLIKVKNPLDNYEWKIHSYGKTFYEKKFGDLTMSASKIKEMIQDQDKSNFNTTLFYSSENIIHLGWDLKYMEQRTIGICISYENEDLFHYAYPFYDTVLPKEISLGMNMIISAISKANEENKKYFYLGSVNDKKSHYKLQFVGLEWYDTESNNWNSDLTKLTEITSD